MDLIIEKLNESIDNKLYPEINTKIEYENKYNMEKSKHIGDDNCLSCPNQIDNYKTIKNTSSSNLFQIETVDKKMEEIFKKVGKHTKTNIKADNQLNNNNMKIPAYEEIKFKTLNIDKNTKEIDTGFDLKNDRK